MTIAGGNPANGIARWNGASWSEFAGGLTGGNVSALAFRPTGELLAGGSFTHAAGNLSVFVAHAVTTCPPAGGPYGTGCPSSGGSNTLTQIGAAYADGTFRALGTGLPTVAIVAFATSLASIPQGAVPLAGVLAEGVPGCDLLVAPDILDATVTLTGTAESMLQLPNVPPIVGVTFYHQMIPFELNGMGAVIAITATNALQVTPGAF
jgi:hypothetical protein